MTRKLVSIITPCFNEEANVRALYEAVRSVFAGLPRYRYEHIFCDNASTDGTVPILREIAASDRNVRVILNARNFGHMRSPFHATLQARGNAVIGLVCDFQDPPELIPELIRGWEEGYEVVAPVKTASRESAAMWLVRRTYYRLLARISNVELVENLAGYCLLDRKVVELLRSVPDQQPYVRGLISEFGMRIKTIPYVQPRRQKGSSKNNLFTLWDLAMVGLTTHSKAPIRLATMTGFALALVSFLISLGYLVMKLVYWDRFQFGMAPLLIGIFFFASMQLFFIGLVGEYVASVHDIVLRRPRIVERERINFDEE